MIIVTGESKNYCLLKNSSLSCLLRINNDQPELLHFGRPVSETDASALTYPPAVGWGESTLYNAEDASSCLDVAPLAWSALGAGDYREGAIELSIDGRQISPDFKFTRFEIMDGVQKMNSTLPQAKGSCETLAVHMTRSLPETEGELELVLYFSLFETALTRRCELRNNSKRTVCVNKIMSSMLDLKGSFIMATFNGGWIAEAHREDIPVGMTAVVNTSTTGFSSNRHNPGYMLYRPGTCESSGEVYGFNLIYSGNHYASSQKSLQGLTRTMQGISPAGFAMPVASGECFETPEAVMTWSEKGFNGMSRMMHRFVNEHIIPRHWQNKKRPVVYNDWEGCMFSFDERKLLSLASKAKKLGCELFVLDDGWFGARNSERAGLGDYTVNRKKLPGGLEGLSAKIKAMDMQFGLWFEPECVNPDSDLYRAHPDWAIHGDSGTDYLGRNQLMLDLRKSEVRDYITENVSRIADSAKLDYIKWDMNRHSTLSGTEAHRYILGLYEVLQSIFGTRPGILLESCSSGGNRFDLGMLCFGAQAWASDNTDPVERLDIQQGLSYLYPQSAMGAHVSESPHSQTLRQPPLTTRENVSFFGDFGLELDLDHLVSVEEKEIKEAIKFYKKHRMTLQFGAFSRLEAYDGSIRWQVKNEKEAIIGLFHKLINAAPGYEWLRTEGFESETQYTVSSRPQGLRVKSFGGLVKHVAPVNINPNGLLIRRADMIYSMPDAQQSFECSGAALNAGIPLHQLYAGTGTGESIRTQGDFGSNIYVITKKEPASGANDN